jgi:hypothetical protein
MEYVIPFAILLAISVVILIISMFITSALGGGVEFGQVHIVLAKAIPLLIVVSLLQLVPFGIVISIPVWWVGLMLLFHLDFWEVRTLVAINWGLNALAHFLLLAMLSKK